MDCLKRGRRADDKSGKVQRFGHPIPRNYLFLHGYVANRAWPLLWFWRQKSEKRIFFQNLSFCQFYFVFLTSFPPSHFGKQKKLKVPKRKNNFIWIQDKGNGRNRKGEKSWIQTSGGKATKTFFDREIVASIFIYIFFQGGRKEKKGRFPTKKVPASARSLFNAPGDVSPLMCRERGN